MLEVTELKTQNFELKGLSGWRGSNPRPTAWKAVALPTELHPLLNYTPDLKNQSLTSRDLIYDFDVSLGGGRRIRTFEVIRQRIYSPSQLAALVSPRINL